MHADLADPIRLTAAHAPALVALVNGAYRGDSGREGWTTESDLLDGIRLRLPDALELLANPDVCILGIADPAAHDRLLACVCLEQARPDAAYLGMLSVNPRSQRAGVGKRVMAAAEAWVRTNWPWARAMEMTVIAVRSELIAFYERRGYRATGERRPFPAYEDPERFGHPKRPGLDFVVLRKPLA